jgi:single-strand DNA-binding protein
MLNSAILMGRLTADPERKMTQSGVSVCGFKLAVDRAFKDKNGERAADFIACVAWRETAEFISKYFRKGSMMAVQGEIQTRDYTNQNGEKRYVTEVVVRQASFTGEKQREAQPAGTTLPNAEPRGQTVGNLAGDDDDLPF